MHTYNYCHRFIEAMTDKLSFDIRFAIQKNMPKFPRLTGRYLHNVKTLQNNSPKKHARHKSESLRVKANQNNIGALRLSEEAEHRIASSIKTRRHSRQVYQGQNVGYFYKNFKSKLEMLKKKSMMQSLKKNSTLFEGTVQQQQLEERDAQLYLKISSEFSMEKHRYSSVHRIEEQLLNRVRDIEDSRRRPSQNQQKTKTQPTQMTLTKLRLKLQQRHNKTKKVSQDIDRPSRGKQHTPLNCWEHINSQEQDDYIAKNTNFS